MATSNDKPNHEQKHRRHPFRQAVLRGLGVVLPPLLTILIFVWVIATTHHYVLQPVTLLAREAILWGWVRPEIIQRKDISLGEVTAQDAEGVVAIGGRKFQRLEDSGYVTYIPSKVYDRVLDDPGNESLPRRGLAYYRRYVEVEYLKPQFTIPFFLSLFILVLYLLGKFMAAGIGRFFWYRFERGIHRLPLVRNVYSSVKQVSDFLFAESEIEYNRVVAVQYPSKGIWSLGLVTGESMLDIRAAANEPVLSLLIPTSPMPMTGFTVTMRKSETIDLNITIEQAFQFIVSCGVVIPPQQMQPQDLADALPPPAAPTATQAPPRDAAAPEQPR